MWNSPEEIHCGGCCASLKVVHACESKNKGNDSGIIAAEWSAALPLLVDASLCFVQELISCWIIMYLPGLLKRHYGNIFTSIASFITPNWIMLSFGLDTSMKVRHDALQDCVVTWSITCEAFKAFHSVWIATFVFVSFLTSAFKHKYFYLHNIKVTGITQNLFARVECTAAVLLVR